ncbi:MAG: GNAT family N-acetyltransferase [Polyangiales bacterium]
MIVSLASPADWARVRAIRLRALADTPDAFTATLAQEAPQPDAFWIGRAAREVVSTFLASVDGEDLGLCVLAPYGDDPRTLGLFSVWVAPTARGRGVGDALLRAVVDRARSLSATRVLLDVGDHNVAAIALYTRHGFRPTGPRSFPARAHHRA